SSCAFYAHGIRAHVLFHRGALDEVAAIVGRAFEDGSRREGRYLATGHMLFSKLALRRGDTNAALREAASAVESARHLPWIHREALAVRARALLAVGRVDEALEAARAAASGPQTTPSADAAVRLTLAEALDAAGERSEARRIVAAARDAILARAAPIEPPEWRASFL